MMKMLIPQKSRNDNHSVGVWPPTGPPSSVLHPGMNDPKKICIACPPIHACIPNQPHATSARINAGTFDPVVPYAARAKTGQGIPHLVPGCELRRIGMSTITFPIRIVMSACHQFIPAEIKPDAITYGGLQW